MVMASPPSPPGICVKLEILNIKIPIKQLSELAIMLHFNFSAQVFPFI